MLIQSLYSLSSSMISYFDLQSCSIACIPEYQISNHSVSISVVSDPATIHFLFHRQPDLLWMLMNEFPILTPVDDWIDTHSC